MNYSFNINGEPIDYYGTSKKETYDVAVCLNNPALTGAKITGISVPIPGEAELYENPGAFLTSELKVERVDGMRVNVPDICSVEANIADGTLTATFAEPYEITSDPVYVGYSFDIKELRQENKFPVAVVSGLNPDGFWLHTSRTALKWANYVDRATAGYQSAMTIILSGDFAEENASLELPGRCIIKTGEKGEYTFTVVNQGSNEISSIECEWNAGDINGTSTCVFDPAIGNTFGARKEATITLPAMDENGEYPVKIEIKKINGIELSEAISAEGSFISSPVVPVTLPMVDEYTGLQCGWCPRGYATLEWMKEKYGYEFVAAAWHSLSYGDPMAVTTSYPNVVNGYPNAYINRDVNLDPGYIIDNWGRYRALPTNIAIECTTEFTDDTKSTLKATAHVTSVEDSSESMRIGYVLVADGLTNPEWGQSNYYAGDMGTAASLPGEWAEFFYAAGSPVMGLVFNDVVIEPSYSLGVMNSLPGEIEAFKEYEHEVEFDLTAITSLLTHEPLEFNPEKTRVLAYVLDPKRTVINSCSSAYPGEPAPTVAVEGVTAAAEVLSTVWYDLQGNRVSAPEKGIFVKIDTMSDGTVRASKAAVR